MLGMIRVTPQDRGRNDTERLLSALRRQDPTFARRRWADQVNHLHMLRAGGAKVEGLVDPSVSALLEAFGVKDAESLGIEELGLIRTQLEALLEELGKLTQAAVERVDGRVERVEPPKASGTSLSLAAPTPLRKDASRVIDVLPTDTGRNCTERLLSALRRQDRSFARRPWAHQMNEVHMLRRDPSVLIREAQQEET